MSVLNEEDANRLPNSMTHQEAMMVFMYTAAMCDGHLTDTKKYRVKSLCARCPTFVDNTQEQDDHLIETAVDWLVNGNLKEVFALANQSLPDKYHETVFAMACDIIYANGSVDDKEAEFLDNLSLHYLPISESQAVAIKLTFACLYRK